MGREAQPTPVLTYPWKLKTISGGRIGRRAQIRWGVTGQILIAWLLTLPAAAGCAAAARSLIDVVGAGNATGPLVSTAVAAALCLGLFVLSRRAPVTAANVNDVEHTPPRPLKEPDWSRARAA
jgi:PiT family inorganic phosphate transporter